MLSFLIILLGFWPLLRLIGTHNPTDTTEGIKVLTYNIGKTRVDFSRSDKKIHINGFKKFIKNEAPDIVCLQERIKAHNNIYSDIFNQYNVTPNPELGTAVYSKYPILEVGNMPFESKAHNATWADIVIKKDTLRFYSIHLSSNRITKVTGEMMENPDISNKELWNDIKFIFREYHYHAKLRSKQLDQILKHSLTSPYPVVLSGDFNDVSQSYIYRKVCSHYKDAFRECGFGLNKTFISFMPGLRIDYTFVDMQIPLLDQYTVKTRLSDHYPVITRIDHLN